MATEADNVLHLFDVWRRLGRTSTAYVCILVAIWRTMIDMQCVMLTSPASLYRVRQKIPRRKRRGIVCWAILSWWRTAPRDSAWGYSDAEEASSAAEGGEGSLAGPTSEDNVNLRFHLVVLAYITSRADPPYRLTSPRTQVKNSDIDYMAAACLRGDKLRL